MRLKISPILCVVVLLVATCAASSAGTLRAAFEAAPAQDGYDRYMVLNTGDVYTGGLLIGPTWDEFSSSFVDAEQGLDVKIVGNGAILDLQGQRICISFCENRLDIEDCIILNGGVRFRGDNTVDVDRTPQGSVRYCTFYKPLDYGVRLAGVGTGVLCERNIVVDAVDTGLDVLIWTGIQGVNLPTGLAFAPSVQIGTFGVPTLQDNWTWFSDPRANDDALHHFGFL